MRPSHKANKHSLLEYIKWLIFSLFIKMNYMVLFGQQGQETSEMLGGENPKFMNSTNCYHAGLTISNLYLVLEIKKKNEGKRIFGHL